MILLLGFILWQTPVHASEFNFAVDFELPANQIDKNKTYINVRMEPGKTQEIPYTVFNRTDKSVTVGDIDPLRYDEFKRCDRIWRIKK